MLGANIGKQLPTNPLLFLCHFWRMEFEHMKRKFDVMSLIVIACTGVYQYEEYYRMEVHVQFCEILNISTTLARSLFNRNRSQNEREGEKIRVERRGRR